MSILFISLLLAFVYFWYLSTENKKLVFLNNKPIEINKGITAEELLLEFGLSPSEYALIHKKKEIPAHLTLNVDNGSLLYIVKIHTPTIVNESGNIEGTYLFGKNFMIIKASPDGVRVVLMPLKRYYNMIPDGNNTWLCTNTGCSVQYIPETDIVLYNNEYKAERIPVDTFIDISRGLGQLDKLNHFLGLRMF